MGISLDEHITAVQVAEAADQMHQVGQRRCVGPKEIRIVEKGA